MEKTNQILAFVVFSFFKKKRLFLFQSRNGILLILFDPEKSKHYKGYVQVFLEVKIWDLLPRFNICVCCLNH